MTQSLSPKSHSSAAAALSTAEVSQRSPTRNPYPPISSIPQTSPQRLAQASEDSVKDAEQTPNTVLYLAYGSNMSAQSLLGMRRVRPLSRVNVSVPSLELTFDLPGIPYSEPCFANVGVREVSERPKQPDTTQSSEWEWDGSLVGVVYEVTEKDYRNIVRTEGGGSSYQEIIVPCFPIHSDQNLSKTPPFSSSPKPFLARTLYARHSPTEDGPCGGNWLRQITTCRTRPDPNYAWPSARYLNLLKDGARDHGLPAAYQQYMASLQSYTPTSVRETIGKILLLCFWAPPMIFFFSLARLIVNEEGRVPKWLGFFMTGTFNLIWVSYDNFFKTVLGEGERIVGADRHKWKDIGATDERSSLL